MNETLKTTIVVTLNGENGIATIDEKGFENIIGEGCGVDGSVNDLLLKMKLAIAKDEVEKSEIYFKQRLPIAKKIAIDLYEKIGSEPITLNQIIKKSGESRQIIESKLEFIFSFGFSVCDKTAGLGKKWCLVLSEDNLISHYEQKISEFSNSIDYFKKLIDNLNKLKSGELEEEIKNQKID